MGLGKVVDPIRAHPFPMRMKGGSSLVRGRPGFARFQRRTRPDPERCFFTILEGDRQAGVESSARTIGRSGDAEARAVTNFVVFVEDI